MTKIHVALTEQQVRELSAIEEATDRPRTRILRRAVTEYLLRYREAHPEFAAKMGAPVELEKEFKHGIRVDTAIIGGMKTEVVITPEGWRMPRPDDYVQDGSAPSVLDEAE
jgi:metal-responsive CopG/Arc/MetJ family transcriptional regulator